MRMFVKSAAAILIVLFMAGTAACSTVSKMPELKSGSSETLTLSDTDYSNIDNWLSFGGDKSRDVDVFLIYPTVSSGTDESDIPFVRLKNQEMRDSAKGYLEWGGGVVSESANIYAPYYRQANIAVLTTREALEECTASIPREDIFAAFDYYLTNINKGERPYIIYGFSQGAAQAIELATVFLGNEKYYEHNKRHIITYAIGCSVIEEQIARNPNLKFSERMDDTGVIVSWNTIAPGELASGAYTEFPTWETGALVTNPITWETGETLAHASDNGASLVIGTDGATQMIGSYANALVDNEHNTLITTTVDESFYTSKFPFLSKFHPGDIRFYYDSIKQNVKERITAFASK